MARSFSRGFCREAISTEVTTDDEVRCPGFRDKSCVIHLDMAFAVKYIDSLGRSESGRDGNSEGCAASVAFPYYSRLARAASTASWRVSV